MNEKNVIIRNVKISKVLAEAGDAIGVQAASQVWLDHLDLSSDRDHDKVRCSPVHRARILLTWRIHRTCELPVEYTFPLH